MVPSFMAASAAAGTPFWLIHPRIVVSSEVATCARLTWAKLTWAKLSPARAAESGIASARLQSATPRPARFHGLAAKREAEAGANMGHSFGDDPFQSSVCHSRALRGSLDYRPL